MNINLPELAEGETYIGCIGDALGNLHHVILLPGDNDDTSWEKQMEWAKSIGGYQDDSRKDYELRARAVRRLVIAVGLLLL